MEASLLAAEVRSPGWVELEGLGAYVYVPNLHGGVGTPAVRSTHPYMFQKVYVLRVFVLLRYGRANWRWACPIARYALTSRNTWFDSTVESVKLGQRVWGS